MSIKYYTANDVNFVLKLRDDRVAAAKESTNIFAKLFNLFVAQLHGLMFNLRFIFQPAAKQQAKDTFMSTFFPVKKVAQEMAKNPMFYGGAILGFLAIANGDKVEAAAGFMANAAYDFAVNFPKNAVTAASLVAEKATLENAGIFAAVNLPLVGATVANAASKKS